MLEEEGKKLPQKISDAQDPLFKVPLLQIESRKKDQNK